jgi:hypothetical protein
VIWVDLIEAVIWPVAVVVILWILASAKGRDLMEGIFRRVRHVSAFGLEVDLTEEGAVRAHDSAEEIFDTYRTKIRREFERVVNNHLVNELRRTVVEDFVWELLSEEVKRDVRCTIHVRDILFEETMYQLLDYYPRGGGGGRSFSMRRGIVGRAWRSGEHQSDGNVSTDSAILVRDWGMTSEEAVAAGQGRKSFACFILRDERNIPLGTFYLDSHEQHAFEGGKAAGSLQEAVLSGAQESGLISALTLLGDEMRRRGPTIRVYG